MKKISTLAVALMTLGSLAMPAWAQNVMPKASDGTNTYTYYLKFAGKKSGGYVQKAVGSSDEVQYSTGTSDRLQVKLVSVSGKYNVVATNLDASNTKKFIGCPSVADKQAATYYEESSAKNAAWNISIGTATDVAMQGYYPFYTIAQNSLGWNPYGGEVDATSRAIKLHKTSDQGTNLNFIPADLVTLKAYAADITKEIASKTGDKSALETAASNATSATAYTEDLATNLLDAYTTWCKQLKVADGKTQADALLANTEHKGELGYYAEDAYTALTAAKNSWTTTGTYNKVADDVNSAISTFKSSIVMPEDGKVYRIYAKWADGTKIYAVNDGSTTTTNSKYYTSGSKTEPTDNKGLWIVQKVGGNYNFASAVANSLFTYVQGANGNKAQIVNIIPSAGKTLGQFYLGAEKANVHIVMNSNASKLDQLTDSNADTGDWSTQWCFEEVTNFAGQPVNFAASTDGKNYATLNLPYASTLPTGVTAYKATVEGTTVNLTEYRTENQVLPANTPVLLTATTAGSKTFAPATYAAAEETGFKGTLGATTVAANNTYILSKKNGKVNFFALDETNNTIKANKAYLVVSGGAAQALNFNFGNTTGIQNAAVEGVNANAPLFDLSGRRVVKAVKGGIYIQNGKKFVK
mgnify:CR=1 FL=1